VATLPYPGVATDYKPLLTAMLSVATGVSSSPRNLFVGRFRYVDELCDLARASPPKAPRHDPRRGLTAGTSVRGTDIRAAAALVLAGLVAHG